MEREPGGTGRRAVLVRLTPDGHALVERSVDIVLGREAALVSDLSAGERTALTALLDKLTTDVRRRTGRAGGRSGRG